MTTLTNRLGILTMPPSLAPLRLMLADTPFPRGSGATLANVGTLSGSTERFVASPLYPVGYVRWGGRSDRFPLSDNHSNSLQVAKPSKNRA